ncbi:MAG: uracil-DNA glycosylase [Alphaproteobacteria bacterium]|nr:uracil-DNA glycosylase [Rickettsiales bacterium]
MDQDVSYLLDILSFQRDLGVSSSCLEHDSNSVCFEKNDITNNFKELCRLTASGTTLQVALRDCSDKKNTIRKPSVATKVVAKKHASYGGIVEEVYSQVDKINNLDQLKQYILDFDKCKLKLGTTNTVICDGQPTAKIMLIGEAPGEKEDLRGIPFCGKSGLLLDEVLLSIGVKRSSNIYISNSVFWKPPGNRKPTDEEIAICKPLVEKHISLIAPSLLLPCGATALQTLLAMNGITKLTGVFFDYNNRYLNSPIKAMPIFHPAFLLRNPISKKTMWGNMLLVKEYCLTNGISL